MSSCSSASQWSIKDFLCPQCKKCKSMYIIFGISIVLFMVYFYLILRPFFSSEQNAVPHDPMNVKVFDFPLLENCCSWWPISHFFAYLLAGIFFPDCDIAALTIGLVWEGFEVLMSALTGGVRQPVRKSSKAQKYEYSQNWWAGSFKDIFMNISGFYVGKFLNKVCHLRPIIKGFNDEKESLETTPCTECFSTSRSDAVPIRTPLKECTCNK